MNPPGNLQHPLPKIPWGKIALLYAVAFLLSGIFNAGWLTPQYQTLTAGWMIQRWPFLPAGIGTLLAALLAFRLDRTTFRTITLLGNHRAKNILTALVPIGVFTVLGVQNSGLYNEHYYGLVFSLVALGYAVSEEVFWRSYLLDAFRPLGKLTASLIIGVLWWAWHFRFGVSLESAGFLLLCLVSSFLLCQFATETKSYLTAAGLHSLIIVTTSEGFTQPKALGLGITISIWILLGKVWKIEPVQTQ